MVPGIPDKIPYDQEIIHISHILNNIKLIVQTLFQLFHIAAVPLGKPVKTQLVQVFPGCIALRDIEFRQLCHAEFYLHITALGYLVGILQSLRCIGKQGCHLLHGFHVILAALIAHSVLVLKPFAGLHAQENVMGLRVCAVGIVDIIGSHQFDSRLPAHTHKLLIHSVLLRYTVVLQFQEKIPLSENLFISQSRLFGLLIKTFCDISCNFSCKASA